MFYKELAQTIPEMNKYINGRLLKLYVFLCYDAGKEEFRTKISEYLTRKAAHSDKYKSYLEYLNDNPEDDESEKIDKLHKLTQVTTADENAELITIQSQRDTEQFIVSAQKFGLEKENAKILAAPVAEAEQPYILMNNGMKLNSDLCKKFTDGRTCYVYCTEEALNQSGQLIDEFKHQIYTQPGFVNNPKGQNGFKFLESNVFEVKIKDDPRIIGFETRATLYVGGKAQDAVSLLYFNKYVDHPHGANGETKAFRDALKEQIKEAKKLCP